LLVARTIGSEEPEPRDVLSPNELKRCYIAITCHLLADAAKRDELGIFTDVIAEKLAEVAFHLGTRGTGDIVRKFGSHLKRIDAEMEADRKRFENRIHSDYLWSYHIEVLALKVLGGNLDDTPWHVFRFFEDARVLLAGSLWYDTGNVDDYLSWSDRQEVLKRFDTAIERSRSAWHRTYNGNGDDEGAIEIWRQMFGTEFPSYG
jgi:hypothetical protein